MVMRPPELVASTGARLSSASSLPAGLTAEEALPSRQTELALLDRILSSLAAVVSLVFTGLIALETCRRSRMTKGTARGLMPLLRQVDHRWIAAAGIATPWLWWWGVSRLSPLGMRDGEFEPWTMLVWLLQPLAGLIFGMVMLLQTVRWRWGLRGGFLGLQGSLPWFGWGVAVLAGLAVPAAGAIRYAHFNDERTIYYLLGVASVAACGLLWLLWQGIMTLFTPRSGALGPNLTMRALLPWALTGTFTLLTGVAISTFMERHWFAKDPLFPIHSSKTHLNALEERMDLEIRGVLKDL